MDQFFGQIIIKSNGSTRLIYKIDQIEYDETQNSNDQNWALRMELWFETNQCFGPEINSN